MTDLVLIINHLGKKLACHNDDLTTRFSLPEPSMENCQLRHDSLLTFNAAHQSLPKRSFPKDVSVQIKYRKMFRRSVDKSP